MSLKELKTRHEELLFTNNVQCGIIGVKMEAYTNLLTESLDLRGKDLELLSESDQCEVYQNRINSLEAKEKYTLEILKAVKDGKDLKQFDLFENDNREKRYYTPKKD